MASEVIQNMQGAIQGVQQGLSNAMGVVQLGEQIQRNQMAMEAQRQQLAAAKDAHFNNLLLNAMKIDDPAYRRAILPHIQEVAQKNGYSFNADTFKAMMNSEDDTRAKVIEALAGTGGDPTKIQEAKLAVRDATGKPLGDISWLFQKEMKSDQSLYRVLMQQAGAKEILAKKEEYKVAGEARKEETKVAGEARKEERGKQAEEQKFLNKVFSGGAVAQLLQQNPELNLEDVVALKNKPLAQYDEKDRALYNQLILAGSQAPIAQAAQKAEAGAKAKKEQETSKQIMQTIQSGLKSPGYFQEAQKDPDWAARIVDLTADKVQSDPEAKADYGRLLKAASGAKAEELKAKEEAWKVRSQATLARLGIAKDRQFTNIVNSNYRLVSKIDDTIQMAERGTTPIENDLRAGKPIYAMDLITLGEDRARLATGAGALPQGREMRNIVTNLQVEIEKKLGKLSKDNNPVVDPQLAEYAIRRINEGVRFLKEARDLRIHKNLSAISTSTEDIDKGKLQNIMDQMKMSGGNFPVGTKIESGARKAATAQPGAAAPYPGAKPLDDDKKKQFVDTINRQFQTAESNAKGADQLAAIKQRKKEKLIEVLKRNKLDYQWVQTHPNL